MVRWKPRGYVQFENFLDNLPKKIIIVGRFNSYHLYLDNLKAARLQFAGSLNKAQMCYLSGAILPKVQKMIQVPINITLLGHFLKVCFTFILISI